MVLKNKQKLIDGFSWATKSGLEILKINQPTVFFDKELCAYKLLNEQKIGVLDTVLIGVEGCIGERLVDLSRILSESEDYVLGLLEGLAFEVKPGDSPS